MSHQRSEIQPKDPAADYPALHYANYRAGQAAVKKEDWDSLEEHRGIGSAPLEEEDEEEHRASLNKAIGSGNVGYKLLQKMGWKEDTGLGKNEKGMKNPVPIDLKDDRLGLGKKTEEEEYTNPENVSRKILEIEKEQTPELQRKQEERRQKFEALEEELSVARSNFYCTLCSKQYKNAMEIEAHLDSYEHHHKKRFIETKKMMNKEDKDERAKKEAARLEKEMKRFEQQAALLAQQQQRSSGSSDPPRVSPAPSLPTTSQVPASLPTPLASAAPVKFGFAMKPASNKALPLSKKPKTN